MPCIMEVIRALTRNVSSAPIVMVENVIEKAGLAGHVAVASRYSASRSIEDEYDISDMVLGKGGMSGDVMLATGRGNHATTRYAVKSLKKHRVSAQERTFVKNEVEIYLSLDHPHIARLEQVFEKKDRVDLVMECMEGGELFSRLLDAGRFDEKRAAVSIRQVLLAVRYLHAHGVVHRDLKPENFMYERDETHHLKLIDFGFATRWDGKTPMTLKCGSPDYSAPEVLFGSYTDKADMWSVGVIAFTLLIGKMPTVGKGAEELKNIRPGSLSEGAQSFIKSLLVVNFHDRLSAADALKHPWLEEMDQHESASIDSGILQSLRLHAQAPALERACLSVAAWCLPLEETIMLRNQFSAIDADGNGTITCDAFKQALGLVGENQGEVETLFTSLDINGHKEITYSEFLAGALQGRVHLNMEAVRETFSRFDADGSGEITAAKLRSVGFSVDAEALVHDADADAKGAVSLQEFFTFLQRKCGMIEERVEFSAWDGSRRPSTQSSEGDETRPLLATSMTSFVRPFAAFSGMLSL